MPWKMFLFVGAQEVVDGTDLLAVRPHRGVFPHGAPGDRLVRVVAGFGLGVSCPSLLLLAFQAALTRRASSRASLGRARVWARRRARGWARGRTTMRAPMMLQMWRTILKPSPYVLSSIV